MPNDVVNEVAERLRGLREACETPADELADALGVPVGTYLGYEDGSVDIPISILYKVTSFFHVDMTELLTGKAPKLNTYCVVRAGQGISIDRYPGYEYKSVAFNFINRKMEPLIVHLEYGQESADKKLVTHSGQEFNYVINGAIKLTLGNKDIILKKGDCCYFDPTIPHGQSAAITEARDETSAGGCDGAERGEGDKGDKGSEARDADFLTVILE